MTAERPFYIYCHTAPNGKRYIGQTCQNPEQRWRNGRGYKGCVALVRAIKKYGWDSFDHQILAVVHSQAVANMFEKHYIERFGTFTKECGYNLTEGGTAGYTYSDEVRARLSKMAKERGISPELSKKMKEGRARNGWRRRPMTDEEKQAVSERMKGENNPHYGKKMPREWVEKRVASVRGRKASEEARRNQSIGLRNSEKVKAKRDQVLQIDGEGLIVATHEGVAEAARHVGVTKQAIANACRGICNTAKGYRWEYSDEGKRAKANAIRRQRNDASTIGLPVIQCDKSGNEIAWFESTGAASKETGFPRIDITACCRGRRKTSHGYVWRYQERAA